MRNLFYRNRQLLWLTITLIVVWGLSAFFTLPRREDPQIIPRYAAVTTLYPGASPERVEALVSEKIETELRDIEELESIASTSMQGVSIIDIEIKDTITDVEPIWAKVRNELEDISPDLPLAAEEPEFEESKGKANSLIVGLYWQLQSPVNYAILHRVAQNLEGQLRNIPGTDSIELFGEPDEEILVAVDGTAMNQLGLTIQQLAAQITASDAKVSAGEIRSRNELLFEVDSNLDSLERIRRIPIKIEQQGQVAQVGDIAEVTKGIQEPVADLALVNGQRGVVIAVRVESDFRVDSWAQQAHEVLNTFEENQLTDGLALTVILDQSHYVEERLNGIIGNLIISSLLVIGVSLLILGWRSALIVGSALPLSVLIVFGAMKSLQIPLHQMSVTGLIIALGLLIDNAIVVVDEVNIELKTSSKPSVAVQETVQKLFGPLLASTLTTIFAFFPIAVSAGPTGEFIGTIGITVILALLSSFALSMTIIVSLAGLMHQRFPQPSQTHWWTSGFTNARLTAFYRWSLVTIFRRPVLGIMVAMLFPIIGFIHFASLPQQFFPPTNRDQLQIEIQLPATAAIAETQTLVQQVRDLMRSNSKVDEIHWFLGKNAPSFFYNVVNRQENQANYAQGIVQLNDTTELRQTIQSLQTQLDQTFPQAQILVKQLEQGPPFDAPIQLRIYGSDMNQLREIGNQLRQILSEIPDVIHTQADLAEISPKLSLQVDEVAAQRVGLSNDAIAAQLSSQLDGITGGSILEDTEELPVRVRLSNQTRGNLDAITSLDLLSSSGQQVPLASVASVTLQPATSSIARREGQRVNNILGFITAGALPDNVLTQFQKRLQDLSFTLPPGYRIEYGGEADARGDAVGNLLSTVGVLMILMVATLVLSFNSFALAGLLGVVAIAAVGLAALSLWLFNSVFGFTAILGTLGLIGVAINDSIVVLAALREDPLASRGHRQATVKVILQATRHVIATTITTMISFVPLILDPSGFWPPLAIAVAGGLGGATLLALYFIPSAHLLIFRQRNSKMQPPITQLPDSLELSLTQKP